MRFTKLALFAALLSPVLLNPAFGQRGGGGGHAGGGGHVSGGVARGGVSGGSSFRGGVSGGSSYRGGAVVRGYRGGYYGGRGYYYGRGYYGGPRFFVGIGGWNYPYYYGAYPYGYAYDPYYYDPYPYGYQVQTVPAQPYPQQAPNQGQYGPPPQQQTQPQATNGSDSGNYFLIAFKDHSIQAATAYKVEGDQIHWMTRDGQERQAPLSSVDIADSQKLNRDRNVDFRIP
jgi:hypothetical protein